MNEQSDARLAQFYRRDVRAGVGFWAGNLFRRGGANRGATGSRGITALAALALAGWVAVTIVPALARRTSLRWLTYHVSYRVTREGIVYLAGIFIVAMAALNTGNNLTFSGSGMHARGNCFVGNCFAHHFDGN